MRELLSGRSPNSTRIQAFLITLGGGLIYLGMLLGGLVGMVALLRHLGAREAPFLTFFRGFLNALYLPTVVILMLAIIGIAVFAMIKFISEGGSDSAKLTITFFIFIFFSVIGSIGALGNYRPEPTTAYVVVFLLLTAALLILYVHFLIGSFKDSLIPKAEQRLLMFPYVILSVFSAMSLILAMVQSIKAPAPEGEGLLKVCTGIAMPLLALACLFIPLGIGVWLDSQRAPTETQESEPGPSEE